MTAHECSPVMTRGTSRRLTSDYGAYVSHLRGLLTRVEGDGIVRHRVDVASALDGQAAEQLGQLVDLEVRRELGAFFTTSDLRRAVLAHRTGSAPDHVYFDPACGGGDLLIEAAMRMPVLDDYRATVKHWSDRLLGCDLEPEFVETAKLRLLLAAAYRSEQPVVGSVADDAFPGLVVGDGLAQSRLAGRSNHIVMNPPFGYIHAPVGTVWAGGRVSAAAVFLARVVEYAPMGAMITAILPDVLRSGTRYRRWRAKIESMVAISEVEPRGIFGEAADIDVFVLRGIKGYATDSQVRWVPRHRGTAVGDYFDVHVGAVVPHRDPELGPRFPFIWPSRLPLSGTLNPQDETRKFSGRTSAPPFVAIRRTSRPGQKRRAGGVLIVGDSPVAVENHLLVALPKDGSKSSCERLLDVLADQRTADWLDQQICTRHLTVSAIRDLPWLDLSSGV